MVENMLDLDPIIEQQVCYFIEGMLLYRFNNYFIEGMLLYRGVCYFIEDVMLLYRGVYASL